MSEKLFILFNDKGDFQGFYTDEQVIRDNFPLMNYKLITKEIRDELLTFHNGFIVNMEKMSDDIQIIDSMDYFIKNKNKKYNLEKWKIEAIESIKLSCGNYITAGINIYLPDKNRTELFTYKIEDQINIKNILEQNKEDNMVYYHAAKNFDDLYTYRDLSVIYKELENNKNYNLIYTDVFCKWINENFTKEMYFEKENIIFYGFSNDEILQEVEERYAKQQLL